MEGFHSCHLSLFIVILGFLVLLFSRFFLFCFSKAWLNKRPEVEAEVLKALFDKSFEEIFRYVQENCVFKMDILEHNYIVQVS